MEDAPLENDSITWPKGDASLKVDLEMTQCNAEEKKKRKRKRKRKNQTSNSLKSKDTDDNLPNDTSIKASPIKIDSILHPPVHTCLSTDSEIIQHDAEVTLSQKIDNGKKKNSRHNALTSNDTNHNIQDGGRRPSCYLTNNEFVERVDGNSVSEAAEQLSSFQKCLDASSTNKHDDQAQVDTSFDVSCTKPIQTKKRVKRNRRKKRKLSDSTVTGLGSIKEAASPSVLVVQDSSVRDTSLNHSDEAYASGCSEKMMGVGEVVVNHGTSLMVTGDISLDKASGGCPDGEPACGQQEKKVELENLKGINNEQSVVNNASQVEIFCEHGNREDKPNVVQNAVLNDDRAQVDTSLDVSSTKPNQRKKRVKRKWRKRRKLADSTVNVLGSIKEAASPSVLVVHDSSVRDTSLNHSDEAYASGCSEKMMGVGEVVADHGTSLMVTGNILLDKASGGCPVGERASGEQEKKVEMENLKAKNNEQSVANDASQLNLPEIFCEHVDGEDKPNAIQNAVLDDDQPIQTKKRVKRNRRKKRKLSDSTITGLESIKEAASPSVLVVQDSSVRDTSLNHSDEAYASGCSEKMMGVGEVVADHGTSLMVTGGILLDKASGGCPFGEPASGEQEKKVEMENLKAKNNEQSVANDASQLNLPEIFCEHVDKEDKPNAIQNAVLDDDQAQVDTSLDVSSTKPIQMKKRVKRNRRKKRKLSDSTITGLESIKEAASPSVLVVQDSSVRDTSLNHSDDAYASGCSEKMMGVGEVVADHVASLMVIGDMFLDKASGGCPDGEPACGQQEKKAESENLKGINNEQSVVNNASQVEIFCVHGNREDKPNVIQNAVLDDDLPQVDTCLDMSSTKPNQRKKRVKRNRKKRRKSSGSTVNGLGSIKEAATPSVLVVQDSSVRATSLNHSDEAYASGCSEKMMGVGEVVADHGTSLMVARDISLDKASGGCPDGKPASWEQGKKVELENLKRINNEQSVMNNASQVDLPEIFCEHGNRVDKPNIIQNAVLDDDQAQVDTSFDLSSTNLNQKKKRVKSNPRKRRNLSDSRVTGLGSIKEAASSSLVVVQDSSVRDTLNQSDEACASGCSEKMMGVGEVVAEHGTSLLVTGDISLDKASGVCPDGEPASMEQEKKVEMENLKGINNDQSVVNDASQVDLPDFFFKHGNRDKDKPNVIQNAVLDVSAEEICHKSTTFYKEDKASDDASGSDPSVENLEYDNLDIQPKLKDAIPSSSQLGAMTDDDHDVSLAVIGKEGPRQRLQSSVGVPPGNLRKKLLVLDVNGLLADIVLGVSKGYKPDTIVSKKAVFKRPFCDDFLQFCFERFRVGVWSSRTKKNVESVLDFLMGKSKRNLLFCWNQSHCTDTGFYTVEDRDKPLVLKEIKKLWEKHDRSLPWKRGEYNESNTLLLDDSPYKALRNPPHTAIFPHSYQYKDVNDNSLGPGGDLRVYLEGLALADNVQKYVELNPFGQRPITKTNLSWGFYLKVIGNVPSLEEEDA